MKTINFDCFKDDCFKYSSLYNEKLGNPDGCERKKPELREKDELFAFKWPNLPKQVQEAVAKRIRHMSGLKIPHEDVLRIFKCLVARDIEIPMPWIEIEKGKAPPPRIFHMEVFNEETFETEIKTVGELSANKAEDVYYVHDYIGTLGSRKWLRDKDGYTMRQAWNSNLLTMDRHEARMQDYKKAAEICADNARRALLVYIGGEVRKGNVAHRVLEQLNGRDWTKKGTAKLTKADFMEQPREWDDRYSEWHDLDWKLLDTIQRYNLSTAVNQTFIDWIASGCRMTLTGTKRSKLSTTNYAIVTAVNFPELTRANVIDCYHGMPGDILIKLQPGDTFTCDKDGTKYVVFRTSIVDSKKVIAYAKDGTVIDEEGFISPDDIRFGIDEELIEECWDCLFDVNRRGRRKKILKIGSIEKAVNSMLR